jgi:hypothetical protein
VFGHWKQLGHTMFCQPWFALSVIPSLDSRIEIACSRLKIMRVDLVPTGLVAQQYPTVRHLHLDSTQDKGFGFQFWLFTGPERNGRNSGFLVLFGRPNLNF